MKRKLSLLLAACLLMTGCGASNQPASEQSEAGQTLTTVEAKETTTGRAATTTVTTTTAVKATTTVTTTTSAVTTTIPEPTEDDAGGEFDVERGFFVTKLSFPVSALKVYDESYDAEQNLAKLKEENADWLISAEIDGDNIIYTMKTSEYNKWRKESHKDAEDEIDKIVSDETNSIIDITHDDDYADLYVYVTDEESYSKSWDSLSIMGLAVGIQISNSLLGFFSDTLTVHVIDSSTGTEFFTDTYGK